MAAEGGTFVSAADGTFKPLPSFFCKIVFTFMRYLHSLIDINNYNLMMTSMNKKIATTLVSIALAVQTVLAEVDGRWYSLEEHHSSGKPSVIWLILAVFATIVLLIMLYNDDSNKEDRGCFTIFFIGIIVLAILVFAKCD